MIRNDVLDLVKVGDTYQILNPDVIRLPDLTKRDRAKQIRADYIVFGTECYSKALPPPSTPKYKLMPHTILAAAVRLECKSEDTALSYALGAAAGRRMLKEGDDPFKVIEPIYGEMLNKKKKEVWYDKPPENPPWDNYCARKDDGWFYHRDGYYMRPSFTHPEDGYIHKIHVGKGVTPTPKHMDEIEQRRYDAYVKGEVSCG